MADYPFFASFELDRNYCGQPGMLRGKVIRYLLGRLELESSLTNRAFSTSNPVNSFRLTNLSNKTVTLFNFD